MLDIELEHVHPSHARQNYAELDFIIDAAEDELDELSTRGMSEREEALATLEAISRVLQAYGFEYNGKQLFSVALRSKGINCDGYSAIYLAVGEALDLPIQMVRAPAHTFIRWYVDDDEYINWETTKAVEKTDAYYVAFHDIPAATIGVGALRSLDVEDDRDIILANAYVNSGVAWLEKCMPEIALERFMESIRRDPTYDTPYYNIAFVYYGKGELGKTIEWCRKALDKNPNHIRSHAVLKEVFSSLNNHVLAQEHLAKVLELDPDYYLKISEAGRTTASVCRARPGLLSLFRGR